MLRASRASGFVDLPITGEHAARVLALEAIIAPPATAIELIAAI